MTKNLICRVWVNKGHEENIFKEDVYHLKEIANKRQNTMDKLTQIKE